MNKLICNLLGTDKIAENEIVLIFMPTILACCMVLVIYFSGILGF